MEHLPEEVILHVLSFLSPVDVTYVQRVSRRLRSIGRDGKLWKTTCFENSQHEALRRRSQAISDQEARLADLRNAINESMLPASTIIPQADSGYRTQSRIDSELRRQRTFANWDPSYPTDHVDFYEEYIHRHAPVSLRYFQSATNGVRGAETDRECLGIGTIVDSASGDVQRLIAPLDDGSVCVWDAAVKSPARGRIVARSTASLLQGGQSKTVAPQRQQFTTETGAVDNVCVDSRQGKAFIANGNSLHEIDLNTLEVVRSQNFPFPITALSEAHSTTPITVGTNMTLHLYDARIGRPQLDVALGSRCELIAGSPMGGGIPTLDVSAAHVSLSQPGPLSILHPPVNSNPYDLSHSIWVAGRFTSLLHYDRRFWPRIERTVFSGARLSSLAHLPYPFVSPQLRSSSSSPGAIRNVKATSGSTIIAAGEYKGKGSLELYGLHQARSGDSAGPVTSDPRSTKPGYQQYYQNRQYASKSRLLSVAPHGARIVFSDGDGVLKWVERDAWTVVRSFNINDANNTAFTTQNSAFVSSSSNNLSSRPLQHSLFIPQPSDDPNSDIVQKILPLPSPASGEINLRDLLIWTGDGRLGLVGFGKKSLQRLANEIPPDEIEGSDQSGDGTHYREREQAYEGRMREALERQADEARWVRGLGLGF